MNPDRLQQIEDLYHAALGEDTTYRAVFLDRACAGDPALRSEVESLLAAHDEADSFIEAPAFEYAAEGLADEEHPSHSTPGFRELIRRMKLAP